MNNRLPDTFRHHEHSIGALRGCWQKLDAAVKGDHMLPDGLQEQLDEARRDLDVLMSAQGKFDQNEHAVFPNAQAGEEIFQRLYSVGRTIRVLREQE